MAAWGSNNAVVMRITAPRKAQKNPIADQTADGSLNIEPHVSKRPQFRASNVMARALALYNRETMHTVSQTMNMALRRFLPPKYVAEAEHFLSHQSNHSSEGE